MSYIKSLCGSIFLEADDEDIKKTIEEPKVEEPKVEEPKVEEPKVEEPLTPGQLKYIKKEITPEGKEIDVKVLEEGATKYKVCPNCGYKNPLFGRDYEITKDCKRCNTSLEGVPIEKKYELGKDVESKSGKKLHPGPRAEFLKRENERRLIEGEKEKIINKINQLRKKCPDCFFTTEELSKKLKWNSRLLYDKIKHINKELEKEGKPLIIPVEKSTNDLYDIWDIRTLKEITSDRLKQLKSFTQEDILDNFDKNIDFLENKKIELKKKLSEDFYKQVYNLYKDKTHFKKRNIMSSIGEIEHEMFTAKENFRIRKMNTEAHFEEKKEMLEEMYKSTKDEDKKRNIKIRIHDNNLELNSIIQRLTRKLEEFLYAKRLEKEGKERELERNKYKGVNLDKPLEEERESFMKKVKNKIEYQEKSIDKEINDLKKHKENYRNSKYVLPKRIEELKKEIEDKENLKEEKVNTFLKNNLKNKFNIERLIEDRKKGKDDEYTKKLERMVGKETTYLQKEIMERYNKEINKLKEKVDEAENKLTLTDKKENLKKIKEDLGEKLKEDSDNLKKLKEQLKEKVDEMNEILNNLKILKRFKEKVKKEKMKLDNPRKIARLEKKLKRIKEEIWEEIWEVKLEKAKLIEKIKKNWKEFYKVKEELKEELGKIE